MKYFIKEAQIYFFFRRIKFASLFRCSILIILVAGLVGVAGAVGTGENSRAGKNIGTAGVMEAAVLPFIFQPESGYACQQDSDCEKGNCISSPSLIEGAICCPQNNNCVVEGECRTSLPKRCSAEDAKDDSVAELGDAINDNWCTYNEHDGCQYVHSGINLVNGQLNPGFWEEESCGGDSGSSILYGEKKVFIDDISKYYIKARAYVDDNSWVWVNGKPVKELHKTCCGKTDWVNMVSYFTSGWNFLKFKAEDVCSRQRYFDLKWNVILSAGRELCSRNEDCFFGNCVKSVSILEDPRAICCPQNNNCVVEGECRTSLPKRCSAEDAKDDSVAELGDAINDNWCTYNEHDNCQYVHSGINLVNGQLNPGFWEEESCGGDSGSSILYGEKKVFIDDISKYAIKAKVLASELAHFYINGLEVPELYKEATGWAGYGDWVDVSSYFRNDWNLLEFKAWDTSMSLSQRYFDVTWSISLRGAVGEKPDSLGLMQDFCNFEGVHTVAPGLSLAFSWKYIDSEGGTGNGWEIWLDDEPEFLDSKFNFISFTPSTSYSLQLKDDSESDWLEQLQWNKIYYWRVRVKDKNKGWSDWSNVSPFTTPLHPAPYCNFAWFPSKVWAKDKIHFCSIKEGSCVTVPQEKQSRFFGEPASWKWDFGDGTASKEKNPIHIYFDPGIYSLRLRITDNDGFSCACSNLLEVDPEVPLQREY